MDAGAHGQGGVTLEELETPCLVLDRAKVDRNIRRLRGRLDPMGVTLRPHLKTAKSIDVARRAMVSPQGPATVSTLREAEYFAGHGVTDLTYAVGIAPGKLGRVAAIRRDHGADLAVVLDNVEAARAVAAMSRETGDAIPALIEIDGDGHRSGVGPGEADLLVAIGRELQQGGASLRGVLTHAGESYEARSPEALVACAEQENAAAVRAAAVLRAAGLPCPVVSVGATPTAHFAQGMAGVTEVRAGVFMFFDLVMAGIGVCDIDDIALSVLATVIGHQRDKGWIIVDAGWMALSRDRGTARQAVDQGYGLVCDLAGQPWPDLIVAGANQEHGIVARRPGATGPVPDLPIGARLRILPNHACATGAQHGRYHVVDGAGLEVGAVWDRINGW